MTRQPSTVPLLDLTRQYEAIAPEVEAAALSVLRSGRYIGGEEIEGLERELAPFLGASEGVALSSGTDALLAALMALEVGPGDEVVTTAYSFFATAGCIARLGAKPVFVDVDPATRNLVPALVEKALTPSTKAVIAVHLFGMAADVPAIRGFCDPRGIPVIEDAAQAIGSRLRGRPVGSLGRAACFSFFPSKNLGCAGDGGFLATTDGELAARVRMLRNHGQSSGYRHEAIGGNFRLDALQAAILRVKLKHLPAWNEARRRRAASYASMFQDAGLDRSIRRPLDDDDLHTYHQYVVEARDRDALAGALRARGIGCAVYYPLALPDQPCFRKAAAGQGPFPAARGLAGSSLALPVFPELTDGEAEAVVAALAEAAGGRPAT